MKPLRFVLLALSMSLPAMANAQSDAHAMPTASDKAALIMPSSSCVGYRITLSNLANDLQQLTTIKRK